MLKFDEYSKIAQVAVRHAKNAFVSDEKLASQWQALRFHGRPDMAACTG